MQFPHMSKRDKMSYTRILGMFLFILAIILFFMGCVTANVKMVISAFTLILALILVDDDSRVRKSEEE